LQQIRKLEQELAEKKDLEQQCSETKEALQGHIQLMEQLVEERDKHIKQLQVDLVKATAAEQSLRVGPPFGAVRDGAVGSARRTSVLPGPSSPRPDTRGVDFVRSCEGDKFLENPDSMWRVFVQCVDPVVANAFRCADADAGEGEGVLSRSPDGLSGSAMAGGRARHRTNIRMPIRGGTVPVDRPHGGRMAGARHDGSSESPASPPGPSSPLMGPGIIIDASNEVRPAPALVPDEHTMS